MQINKFNLKGKTAIITGGAGLLGHEHALALLEIGAKVIITDINKTALINTKKIIKKKMPSASVILETMDVTDENNVSLILNKYEKKKTKIDILINNATIDAKVNAKVGITNSSRLEMFKLDTWNNEIAVGLTGAFICSKVFGFAMSQNQGGIILNIASDLSVIAPDQRLYSNNTTLENERSVKPVTYSVIKFGLIGLTKYLSTYWPDKGVRCNALSPGGIYNGQNEDFMKKVKALIPMQRLAEASEYRSTIQYLCSEASSYMTGQNIIVDGGRSTW